MRPGLSAIMPSTDRVHQDEKAHWLVEFETQLPNSARSARYQVIYVNRGDRLAEFWMKQGEATGRPPLQICSLWEHSVAEVLEIADKMRDDPWVPEVSAEAAARSTLFNDYMEAAERDLALVRNQSQFGPLGSTQRDGYPAHL